jgi:hypothetical protein
MAGRARGVRALIEIPHRSGLLSRCVVCYRDRRHGRSSLLKLGTYMKCAACGGEMHLIDVAPDETMIVPGYEEHTFECSDCHEHVRQLVFILPAIGPLTSEGIRLPPATPKTQNKGVTAKGVWVRAVRAAPPIKAMYVFGILIMIALAGSMITWGQGSRGPVGDQGPPGRLLWPQSKPRHHSHRASRSVPHPRAGEQPTCCGVRADGVSIAPQQHVLRISWSMSGPMGLG